jgi:hypothetical protein
VPTTALLQQQQQLLLLLLGQSGTQKHCRVYWLPASKLGHGWVPAAHWISAHVCMLRVRIWDNSPAHASPQAGLSAAMVLLLTSAHATQQHLRTLNNMSVPAHHSP